MNSLRKTLNHIIPALLVVACGMAIVLSGCKEETGCTNRKADNYNPDAVRDDGSCINARDKFLGVYRILHINWPDSFPNHEDLTPRYMVIAEDNLREVKDDIKFLNFGQDSITVRALVDKNFIRIPQQNLKSGNLELTYWGEGHIDDDGHLTILYQSTLVGGTPVICQDCVIFADQL